MPAKPLNPKGRLDKRLLHREVSSVMKRLSVPRFSVLIASLCGITLLSGCVAPTAKPNDPYYAPVLPRTPMSAASNNGAIYQAGFEQNLYGDRKAFRVGDIITITLSERMAASKAATSAMSKNSTNSIGLTSLFGSGLTTNNPIGGNDLSLKRRLQRCSHHQWRWQGRTEQQPDRFGHSDGCGCAAQRHSVGTRRKVDDAQYRR